MINQVMWNRCQQEDCQR